MFSNSSSGRAFLLTSLPAWAGATYDLSLSCFLIDLLITEAQTTLSVKLENHCRFILLASLPGRSFGHLLSLGRAVHN